MAFLDRVGPSVRILFSVAIAAAWIPDPVFAQPNNVQDFRAIGWNVTQTAASAGVGQAWVDAAQVESDRWFGEDQDGAGIDAACGVRPRIILDFEFSTLPACEGTVTSSSAASCLFQFGQLTINQQFPSGLLIRANGGLGAAGIINTSTSDIILDIDHPSVVNVLIRSRLLTGLALGATVPATQISGTHVTSGSSSVVAVSQ